MDLKYLLKIFIISCFFLSTIILINKFFFENSLNINVEGLENMEQSFCNSNKGFELEKACNNLTNFNCNLTSCCVWNNNKCKAGNSNGPIFNTDSTGKTKTLDYYYFQNKCYGENCPNA